MRTPLLTLTLIVALVLPLGSGCAHGQPRPADPAIAAAQTGTEIVLRLEELQNAAIAAETSGALATAEAAKIVQFTVASTLTIQQTPGGWRPTVTEGYRTFKASLSPTAVTRFAVLLRALDVLIPFVTAPGAMPGMEH